jgi:benzoyl-CoA 2,3-epoxidase subunit A
MQDRIRTEHQTVTALLASPATQVYICGLKGMEAGVEEALSDVCRGQDSSKLKPEMRASGRYHIETY